MRASPRADRSNRASAVRCGIVRGGAAIAFDGEDSMRPPQQICPAARSPSPRIVGIGAHRNRRVDLDDPCVAIARGRRMQSRLLLCAWEHARTRGRVLRIALRTERSIARTHSSGGVIGRQVPDLGDGIAVTRDRPMTIPCLVVFVGAEARCTRARSHTKRARSAAASTSSPRQNGVLP